MIQLTTAEWEALRSGNLTSNAQRGGRRYLPYAFTERGVAMLYPSGHCLPMRIKAPAI
jgi:hypothetical protein